MSKNQTVLPLYTYSNSGESFDQSMEEQLEDGVVESCIIQNQMITGGDFSSTRFRRVVFQNCNLIDCNFSGTELIETRFIHCNLAGSDFSGSVWSDTICWLSSGISIHNAELTNAVFEDCQLASKDLGDCIAHGVEIITAVLYDE